MTKEEDILDLGNMSVADVAQTYPCALEILNRYNLDYCCGGKVPFKEACEKAGEDPVNIWNEVARQNEQIDSTLNFDSWSMPLLVDFIIQHHHQYVKKAIPRIRALLDKVCEVHREDSPFLLDVRNLFDELAEELLEHMPKEEKILFPAALNLIRNVDQVEQLHSAVRLEAPIGVMEHEHDEAGRLIKSIRTLTSNYTPPDYACPTFKAAYAMLDQFDADLRQHIHLENNILFPKILIAQAKFNNR